MKKNFTKKGKLRLVQTCKIFGCSHMLRVFRPPVIKSSFVGWPEQQNHYISWVQRGNHSSDQQCVIEHSESQRGSCDCSCFRLCVSSPLPYCAQLLTLTVWGSVDTGTQRAWEIAYLLPGWEVRARTQGGRSFPKQNRCQTNLWLWLRNIFFIGNLWSG